MFTNCSQIVTICYHLFPFITICSHLLPFELFPGGGGWGWLEKSSLIPTQTSCDWGLADLGNMTMSFCHFNNWGPHQACEKYTKPSLAVFYNVPYSSIIIKTCREFQFFSSMTMTKRCGSMTEYFRYGVWIADWCLNCVQWLKNQLSNVQIRTSIEPNFEGKSEQNQTKS